MANLRFICAIAQLIEQFEADLLHGVQCVVAGPLCL